MNRDIIMSGHFCWGSIKKEDIYIQDIELECITYLNHFDGLNKNILLVCYIQAFIYACYSFSDIIANECLK